MEITTPQKNQNNGGPLDYKLLQDAESLKLGILKTTIRLMAISNLFIILEFQENQRPIWNPSKPYCAVISQNNDVKIAQDFYKP